MRSHWCNLPSFLTPAECERVIKHAQRYYPPADAVVGHGGTARKDKMRSSTLRWLSYSDLELLWLWRRIDEKILVANRQLFGYNLQPSSTELQFTEYHGMPMPKANMWQRLRGTPMMMPQVDGEGDHYDWHEDNSAAREEPMDRKLSFVLQLSDPAAYVGGKFELDHHAHAMPKDAFTKQGDAFIFRSGLRHRVTPVTVGTRYSFVTWVHGPRA